MAHNQIVDCKERSIGEYPEVWKFGSMEWIPFEIIETAARVVQDRPWIEALLAAITDDVRHEFKEHDPYHIGETYFQRGVSEKDEYVNFILIRFPRSGGSLVIARKLAERRGLYRTNPRELFALAEKLKQDQEAQVSEKLIRFIVETSGYEEARKKDSQWVCGIDRWPRNGSSIFKAWWQSQPGHNQFWFLFRKP